MPYTLNIKPINTKLSTSQLSTTANFKAKC